MKSEMRANFIIDRTTLVEQQISTFTSISNLPFKWRKWMSEGKKRAKQ